MGTPDMILATRGFGQYITDLYTTVYEETFKALDASTDERLQIDLVAWYDTSPESHIRPTLASCCFAFTFKMIDSRGGRDRIQRHVYQSCNASRGGRHRSSPETFPVGSAGFIKVDVSADTVQQTDFSFQK